MVTGCEKISRACIPTYFVRARHQWMPQGCVGRLGLGWRLHSLPVCVTPRVIPTWEVVVGWVKKVYTWNHQKNFYYCSVTWVSPHTVIIIIINVYLWTFPSCVCVSQHLLQTYIVTWHCPWQTKATGDFREKNLFSIQFPSPVNPRHLSSFHSDWLALQKKDDEQEFCQVKRNAGGGSSVLAVKITIGICHMATWTCLFNKNEAPARSGTLLDSSTGDLSYFCTYPNSLLPFVYSLSLTLTHPPPASKIHADSRSMCPK